MTGNPFEPTEEQRALCESIKEFGATLNEGMIERDTQGILDRSVWRRCAEFGILGLPIPKEYGGSQRDLMTTLLAMKSLGYSCEDNGLVFSMNAQMWAVQLPLVRFGTEEQKRKYLPALCSGQMIAAHAITEPEAGSDAMAMTTSAVLDGDHYVLNGHKVFITSAPIADVVVCFATVNPAMKSAGITGFIIDRDTPGMTLPPAVSKMGMRTAQMGEIILENCRVPVASRLGREGFGTLIFNSAMEWERTCIFASHLGAMQRLLDKTIQFAKGRKQFGERLSRLSPIADKIVDMKVAIEAGELLLYKAAAVKDAGGDAILHAAIAKLFVSEAHVKQALDAVQIHGGSGVLTKYEIERELRDAIPGTIYSGTSEMQRKIIARLMGL